MIKRLVVICCILLLPTIAAADRNDELRRFLGGWSNRGSIYS